GKWKILLQLLLGIFFSSIIIALIIKFIPEWILTYIITIPIIIAAILFISFFLLKILKHFMRDLRVYGKISNMSINSKPQIEKYFNSFLTETFRLKFVRLVRNQGTVPSGIWSSGKCPNKNDKASNELALLDAIWYGIDR